MSETQSDIIVGAFEAPSGAEAAMGQLRAAEEAKRVDVKVAALVERDLEGRVEIKETHEFGAVKGGLGGAVIGGLLAIVTGGAALVAGAVGAAAGALVGKIHDSGIPNDKLRQMGEHMRPGTSALVVVADAQWREAIRTELQQAGADVVAEGLGSDIFAQMQAAGIIQAELPDQETDDPARYSKQQAAAFGTMTSTSPTPMAASVLQENLQNDV